ncbi:MAG: c-type cytochrome [Rhodopila sp.]|jgi:cytochrome c2
MRWFFLLVGLFACTQAYAQDVEAGQRVFARCAICHEVGPHAQNNSGPVLNKLIGRPAGAIPDYAYSAAMKESGIVWDNERLTVFLNNPSSAVPGTKMHFAGLRSVQDIENVITYLRQFSEDTIKPQQTLRVIHLHLSQQK